jgi:hypothetical protein
VGDRDASDEEIEDVTKRSEDKLFAQNVANSRGDATLQFHTPWEYFGESDKCRRMADKESKLPEHDVPPPTSLQTRAALLGAYLKGPVLLILCGAEGSAKSWLIIIC